MSEHRKKIGDPTAAYRSTAYHARYFAHELTRAGGQGVDRLSRSLFDACVDLNPHQIEAALFALRSPISKGVLLADEVGLARLSRQDWPFVSTGPSAAAES